MVAKQQITPKIPTEWIQRSGFMESHFKQQQQKIVETFAESCRKAAVIVHTIFFYLGIL